MGAIHCSKGSQERTICSFYNLNQYPTVVLLGNNKAQTTGLRQFSGMIMTLHHLLVQSLCAQWLNNKPRKYYYRQHLISNSIIIMMLHMFAYNYYAGNKSARHVIDEALIFVQTMVSDRQTSSAGRETFKICAVSAIKTYR